MRRMIALSDLEKLKHAGLKPEVLNKTITADEWSDNTVVFENEMFDTINVIFVVPADKPSRDIYVNSGLFHTNQEKGELVITADNAPTEDINLTIVVLFC